MSLALCALAVGPSVMFAADDTAANVDTGSGDSLDTPSFGGPGSAAAQIRSDEELLAESCRKGLAAHIRLYCNFKRALHKEQGLRFGVDYSLLYQQATESLAEDHAAGGIVRLFGTWSAMDPQADNPGYLAFKVENRHRLGTQISPQELGSQFGYAGLTAVTFSDAGTLLTNLYWLQSVADGRFGYAVGLVDPTDYLTVYSLANPLTDFSNLAFSTDPTIAVPNQGLGAAAQWRLGDHYNLLLGLADANGDPGEPLDSFDSFFDGGEYFKHVELGWYDRWESRYDTNAQLTLWQADEREEAGVADGWGAAFSFARRIGPRWQTFLRLGYGDGGGALLERSISAGVALVTNDERGRLGLGLNWGTPNRESFGAEARDQYTVEVYYRFQLADHLSVTPDLQFIKDPAVNPGEDQVWVFGLRARVFF